MTASNGHGKPSLQKVLEDYTAAELEQASVAIHAKLKSRREALQRELDAIDRALGRPRDIFEQAFGRQSAKPAITKVAVSPSTMTLLKQGMKKTRGGARKRTGIDWTKVRFDRPIAAIAAELGVSAETVRSARQRHGKQKVHIDWGHASIDWGKTDRQLARQLGCSLQSVARHRAHRSNALIDAKRAAARKPSRGGPKGIDWDKVDLNRPTSVVVAEVGVNPSAVRNAQRKRGIAPFAGFRSEKLAMQAAQVAAKQKPEQPAVAS